MRCHFAVQKAQYIGPASGTFFDPRLASERCIPIPFLDRLVCHPLQKIVDSSKTDYGRFVVRYLTAFVGPVVFFVTVEGSRLGNSGSLFACMPFTAIVTCLYGGGTYLLIFFVPLLNYARRRIQKTSSASRIPLARVHAILVANALHMVSVIFMLTPGTTQEGEDNLLLILLSIAVNAVLMFSLWFIYTPLTWFFEELMESAQEKVRDVRAAHVAEELQARKLVSVSFLFMAAVSAILYWLTLYEHWGEPTPFWHFFNSFDGPFWDILSALGASCLLILSEKITTKNLIMSILIPVLFSPGAALMVYGMFREQYLMLDARSLSE
ncbi:MAG: hypothetical protein J3Q66DRAFT_411656 [Benniella sp.]|nr:MAG: hypothetical protein J3Q66DRAFT_411656 [Benniella sp.]